MEKELNTKLDSIVERIIKTCNPVKVILFGSAASGNMTEQSDFDILVIVRNGVHRRKTAQSIYKNILDIGFATDIIVVTEEDIQMHMNELTSIIKPALSEGKLLYAA